jgi:hypothetical protein
VQGTPSHRLVLDGRLCGGVGIAANSVGKHGLVLFAVFILFVEIPRGVPVEILPVSLFVARDLGRSPRSANFKNEIELGYRTRHNHYSIDASRLEQRSTALVEPASVDFGLGVVLADVVSGRDGVASEIKGRIGRQRRPVERAPGTNRNVVEARHQDPLVWTDEILAKEGKTWRMNSP